MNIVLFGPPGAGKGTQSDLLVKKFNLFKVSAGDLLRDTVKKKSSLGDVIKSTIDQGSLVSDDIINNLIENIISNKIYFNRIIFDGYPRNLGQSKSLDLLIKKYKQKISCAISLKVDKEVITKRILGRQICAKCGLIFNEFFYPSTKENHNCDTKFIQKRSDDNEKIISNRFKTYDKETLPILKHYKNQNLLYEINGMGDILMVYKEICRIIQTLET